MKFSEQWLREWVNPAISSSELAQQLTLAGHEVESIESVASAFSGVVIGEVLSAEQHPDADRLRVCQVSVGEESPLTIVCGGQNVRAGLKVPVAKINAILGGDFKIKKSKLRGVESHGMICSEGELGLPVVTEGIMELPSDAPIGIDIREYLQLDDQVIDVSLTPNRGDCLSILGIAREVAAINRQKLTSSQAPPLTSDFSDTLSVTVSASDACPHYMGRIIRGINSKAQSPLWLRERLRRSDVRPIHPVVDITNYVMLELGQPLHAFDLNQVQQGINVRFAHEKETINLLDNLQLQLSPSVLVIASGETPVALAGIKGGAESGICDQTTDIFLESAWFDSTVVAKTARQYGIFTDSSHRFERTVDPGLQQQALERATALIIAIVGGQIGQSSEIGKSLQPSQPILLRKSRILRMLGIELPNQTIEDILTHLGMQISAAEGGWSVVSPSYRTDVQLEIDVIEELARIYGYDGIPAQVPSWPAHFLAAPEQKLDLNRVRTLLVDRGYQEAITYSFVDPEYERRLALQPHPLQLLNPISNDLSTMRTNHWPALIQAYQYNYHRQQPRVRLFEVGLCFHNQPDHLQQTLRLGGIVAGNLYPAQWAEKSRSVDFFDVKGDIEHILNLLGKNGHLQFVAQNLPALHPGQSAAILLNQQVIGSIGALHPELCQQFDINQALYLFDLNLESIMDIALPAYETLSKFPAIRRDIALVVGLEMKAGNIKDKILDSGGELLKNVQVFDVYQGKGIEAGKKSIALGLTFQHSSRTLVDAEINEFMHNILNVLHNEFSATLRD